MTAGGLGWIVAGVVVRVLLSVLLCVAGALCLMNPPRPLARPLLMVYAIATIAIVNSVTVAQSISFWQRIRAIGASPPIGYSGPDVAIGIFNGLAATSAFPLLLLILLRIPTVRAAFRR
jgi:hypothetical protein